MRIDKLKNIIQSSHINFLFGSGLSCPYLKTLNNIETWLTDTNKIKEEKLRLLIQDNLFIMYVEEVMKPCLPNNRVRREELSTIETAYNEFLSIWNYIMSRRNSNMLNKQVNIFTTNIDPFVEEAAERLRIEFNNGFKGMLNPIFREESFSTIVSKVSPLYQNQSMVPSFNYLKIHGSINWKVLSDVDITYDPNLEVLIKVVETIEQYPKEYRCIELVKKDLEESNKEKSKEESIKLSFELIEAKAYTCIEDGKYQETSAMLEFRENYQQLVMVNPRKTKFQETVLDLHFYELMRLYSNALERVSTCLMVAGFSFADEHIAQITMRAAASNPTLLIIIFAYNCEAKNAIKENLKKGGSTGNNNILILSPKDYQESQENEFKKTLSELKYFDLQSINKFVFNPIKYGIF
jgi:hypothetical protein